MPLDTPICLTACVALSIVIISTISFANDIGPRDLDRNAFIEEINKLRRQAQSPNMMEMVWDEELATIASGYASGCNGFLNPTRNNQSTEFNTVGEVHYIGRFEGGMSLSSLLLDAVVHWAKPHSSRRNDSLTSQECTSCNESTTMYQSEKYAQVTIFYEYSFISY